MESNSKQSTSVTVRRFNCFAFSPRQLLLHCSTFLRPCRSPSVEPRMRYIALPLGVECLAPYAEPSADEDEVRPERAREG